MPLKPSVVFKGYWLPVFWRASCNLCGFLRAGIIGAFFPSAVIEGMLAAIGLILIIKQIPHATGYHAHYEGDESYMQDTALSSFLEVFDSFTSGISRGSVVISVVALLIMILWGTTWFKKQNY